MWSYVLKHSGNNKPRNFCNKHPLKEKGVTYANNYADCVSQYGINIFISITKCLKYYIIASDETNAYAQVPPKE